MHDHTAGRRQSWAPKAFAVLQAILVSGLILPIPTQVTVTHTFGFQAIRDTKRQ